MTTASQTLSSQDNAFANLSRFSRRYSIQVTATRQRDRYVSSKINWGQYPEVSQTVGWSEQEFELTLSQSALFDIANTHERLDAEERMRRHYPAVQDAWEKYQMLLALYS